MAEVVRNRTRGRKEPLGVSGRLTPLHASLALPGGLRRVLRPIAEIPVLAMFYTGEQLSLRCCIAFEFIGDSDSRLSTKASPRTSSSTRC